MAPSYPPIMLGSVKRVERIGDHDAVFASIPVLAPGRTMGPLLTSVPGLAEGDSVIIATVGYARDTVQVIARTHSKFPGIDEIPDLRSSLDARVRLEDFADHENRLDEADGTLAVHADALATLDRGRDRLRTDLEALRKSLGDARKTLAGVSSTASGASTTASAAAKASDLTAFRDEMRIALYGSTDRSAVPQCEIRNPNDITGLAANTDYIAMGSWGVFRDSESATGRTPMAYAGSSMSNPTRVRIPTTGDYDILYSVRAPQTSGTIALKVLLNSDFTATAQQQIINYSVFSEANGAVPEGITVRLRDTGRFDAGDILTFGVWSTVAFSLTAAYFGAIRTRIRVIRRAY